MTHEIYPVPFPPLPRTAEKYPVSEMTKTNCFYQCCGAAPFLTAPAPGLPLAAAPANASNLKKLPKIEFI